MYRSVLSEVKILGGKVYTSSEADTADWYAFQRFGAATAGGDGNARLLLVADRVVLRRARRETPARLFLRTSRLLVPLSGTRAKMLLSNQLNKICNELGSSEFLITNLSIFFR